MTGKILVTFIFVTALLTGGAIYYLQVYYYYEEVAATGTDDVLLTSRITGRPAPLPYDSFQAIDANSSPIRYRACFTTPMDQAALLEKYEPYDGAEPLTGPGWFECFDAMAIGTALEEGTAIGFLGTRDIRYGIDRVVAVTADGRGYVWHQINPCGEVVFDGQPVPEGCPPKP